MVVVVDVEKGGSLPVAGERVEAEEGTGFLFTGSFLGTVTLGLVGGMLVRGFEEISRLVGLPRSIISFLMA